MIVSGTLWFFIVVSLGATLFLVPYLYRRYVDWKSYPWHAYITTTIAWLIAFGYVLILCPLDLGITLAARCLKNTEEVWKCEMTQSEVDGARFSLMKTWQATYWIMFVLGWFVMAIQCSYIAAGDFTFRDRMKTAFRENVIIYSIAGLIGLPVGIALLATLGSEYATGFILALANLYSLASITILLAYGLVNVPRRVYYQFRWKQEHNRLHFEAWTLNQQRHEAQFNVKKNLAILKHLESALSDHHDMRPHLEQILQELPDHVRSLQPALLHEDDLRQIPSSEDLSLKDLGEIRRQLRDEAQEYVRLDVHFEKLVHRYATLDDLMLSEHEPNQVVNWSLKAPRSGQYADLLNRAEWWWHIKIKPYLMGFLFVFFVMWSSFVVIAEMSLVSGRNPNLSIFSKIFDSIHTSSFGSVLLLLLILMTYMVVCTFHTLFKIKAGPFYRLYSMQQSAPDMLVYNAYLLARFAPSLVQNFLKLLREEGDHPSRISASFTQFFGFADLIPVLGGFVDVFFPAILGVVCLLVWFAVPIYHKFLKPFHFALLDWVDDYVESEEKFAQGRDLLERNLQRIRSQPIAAGRRFLSSSNPDYVEMSEREEAAARVSKARAAAAAAAAGPDAIPVELDVQSYLKQVRERAEKQRASRQSQKYSQLDNSV
eukprot:TRINITY_DN5689_c0_g1_i2.p1 TRINITY_DN5689_c0_g1~~TRINITY_DN5689_c0_g1_i2.p1  ORF type:complete len:654 (-),score=94.47 TRINITY_DN5689_c0_g1_i2:128-2089(-)